jgi:CubicO group peptidase (beta-lactamase class C family)
VKIKLKKVRFQVNDLAKWMRLQLANGQFEGRRIVDEKALAVTHSPQILTGFDPLNGLPVFYGLGWQVSYDKEGRLHLSHPGIFTSGAATIVQLVPSEHLGLVVLTNAFPPGVGEGLALTFTDLALYGKATQDWLAFSKRCIQTWLRSVWEPTTPNRPRHPDLRWRPVRTSGPAPTTFMERFGRRNERSYLYYWCGREGDDSGC